MKIGCALRPVVASVAIHRAALLFTMGVCFFLSILTWFANPWSGGACTFVLIAVLAVLTFQHLDRD